VDAGYRYVSQSIMSSWFRFFKDSQVERKFSDLVIKPPGHDGWCETPVDLTMNNRERDLMKT